MRPIVIVPTVGQRVLAVSATSAIVVAALAGCTKHVEDYSRPGTTAWQTDTDYYVCRRAASVVVRIVRGVEEYAVDQGRLDTCMSEHGYSKLPP
jgi:hypothetical protein